MAVRAGNSARAVVPALQKHLVFPQFSLCIFLPTACCIDSKACHFFCLFTSLQNYCSLLRCYPNPDAIHPYDAVTIEVSVCTYNAQNPFFFFFFFVNLYLVLLIIGIQSHDTQKKKSISSLLPSLPTSLPSFFPPFLFYCSRC